MVAPVIVAVHVIVNAPVDLIDTVDDQELICLLSIATILSNKFDPSRVVLQIDGLVDHLTCAECSRPARVHVVLG